MALTAIVRVSLNDEKEAETDQGEIGLLVTGRQVFRRTGTAAYIAENGADHHVLGSLESLLGQLRAASEKPGASAKVVDFISISVTRT